MITLTNIWSLLKDVNFPTADKLLCRRIVFSFYRKGNDMDHYEKTIRKRLLRDLIIGAGIIFMIIVLFFALTIFL